MAKTSGLALAAALFVLVSGAAEASSHREAPLISKDTFADNTDTYVFVSPANPDNVVLIANWIPFEHPSGGPNYFEFDDRVQYQIHVSNDGDPDAEFTYTLQSKTTVADPTTFLYNVGPISSTGTNWNLQQRYTVTEDGPGGTTELVSEVLAPPVNIGSKSTPGYDTLEDAFVYTATAGSDQIKIFAGPRDDPFWVDLQVFDLVTLRGQSAPIGYGTGNNTPSDSLAGFNMHSLVLEIPIARLTQGDEPVLGVWATASRAPGGQVSRLGMPLVNEVVLPLALKDAFNTITPSDDLSLYAQLQRSVEDPELGRLLCNLYDVPLPGDANDDCSTEFTAGTPRTGRGDIFDVFLTGMVLASEFTIQTATGPTTLPAGFNVNRPASVVPADMIRVNTAIKGDLCSPTPSRLGVLGGDACGFPNGRRLGDDIVEIELLAVAGAAYAVLDGRDTSFAFNSSLIGVLDDGVDDNDKPFQSVFPYLASPHSGQDFRSTAAASNGSVKPSALQCFALAKSPKLAKGTTASVEDPIGGSRTKELQRATLVCTDASVNGQGQPGTASQLACFTSKDEKGQGKFEKTDFAGTTVLGDVAGRLKKPVQTCVPVTATTAQ
jgi:hypothetical protein